MSLHRGGKCHLKARGWSCVGLQLRQGLLGATQLLLGQQVVSSIFRGPSGLSIKATSSVKPPTNELQGHEGLLEGLGSQFSLHGVLCIGSCGPPQSDHN